MNPPDLLSAFDRLGHPRVLVLGDLILDRYTFGDAERVSQEAPVILLRADQREARLGGAANVCNMLRGLGAQVTCAGVVGHDRDGELVRRLLDETGVDCAPLLDDPSRPTTVKERFIGRAQGRHPHQMLRVDNEVREPISAALQRELLDSLLNRLRSFDVILVSDYAKGVCTPALLRELIDRARQSNVPLLVDPIRSHDYSRYSGATSMTPNRLEAEMATGLRITTAADAFCAARKLREQLSLDLGIITLDRDGMALVDRDGTADVFPTRPRAVYDITGAGDMALAMIGVAFAARLAPPLALQLANVAAGLEVEKVGVAVIPRAEIRQRLIDERRAASRTDYAGPALAPQDKIVGLDQLERLCQEHRAAGRKVVFTNGCFDLLHVGHVSYLAEARSLGDVLMVGLNSDASVRRLKGPARPVIVERDRATMLAALAAVDHVVIFEEATPHQLLHRLHPDVLVKGGTYTPDEVVGHEVVAAYGGQVCVVGLVDGVSTTKIVESLKRAA
ncbi:MAG TPA: D-glycero-beta-D-manno-heptose 1-phosphate adenylyltransferase [Pirellulales bacterium]|jgi:D-beta-D-heptose 7-phosphate kinase/D-beta-D-heptose 1-phosphate adenosyltransferase|nr:D-glycero-beta-D-manno-heptose 1-phosphate adenylyltransferase [Pirellulales bacterium]